MSEITTQNELVSIVVPVYNVEETIRDCIESLLNLDYENKEIVVINDGSIDDTRKILSEYPITIYNCISRGGAPKARNIGVKLAKGSIIAFTDGDVKVAKDWLKQLIKHFSSPTVGGVGGIVETWNSDKSIPRCIGYDVQKRMSQYNKSVESLATWNCAYRKNLIEKVGKFREYLVVADDIDLSYRIRKLGYEIIFVPKAKVWHKHRTSLWAFFKQQFWYGVSRTFLYYIHPEGIKGESYVNLHLILQPFFYVGLVIFTILSLFINHLFPVAMSYFVVLIISNVFSGISTALRVKDKKALCLIVLNLIRGIAWTFGMIYGTNRWHIQIKKDFSY
ncbi:glycosyltransferase family 2 protein [Candidatus Borrarchaeum sp.]|uniref:glycosyltransferase n=1 Tax=Candidatus Borrarchaeum sp. TaxID=2846742 RepID=UPI00257F5B1C|nr:glycosyltransferase [Candidatus Borrarchaeum sp.]